MRTDPMGHQSIGCARMAENRKAFALAAEQGTGKTWMLLKDAEDQFLDGNVTALFVIAPKGVHSNWIRREIPKHMSIDCVKDYYKAGAGARLKKRWQNVMKPVEGKLCVFSMNIDSINTKDGFKLAETFLMHHEAVVVVDESQKIKTGTAARTKAAIKLGKLARSRRISSGTMISQGPLDAFSQFEFLSPGGGLLGTTSYRAFVAEFAHVLDPMSPIVQHALQRSRQFVGAVRRLPTDEDGSPEPKAYRDLVLKFAPQILQTGRDGLPLWKNLDKLQQLMAPITYRVLKADCLDLPKKVYKTRFYDMTPAQRKVYDLLDGELRYERQNGLIDIFGALTKASKLMQIASGFILTDEEPEFIDDKNPRLDLFKSLIPDVDGKFIVWSIFKFEIKLIKKALEEAGITYVEYHGDVKDGDREAAIDRFQEGSAQAFVAHPRAGGTGLTLTAASTVFYYSKGFSLEDRLQSEDRNHRIGTTKTCVYIDLAAEDSIDETVSYSLQSKENVADAIMNGI
jgi:hypothetical protein